MVNQFLKQGENTTTAFYSKPYKMKRLGFLLPDHTKRAFVSEKAQEIWAPRLERISKYWSTIEMITVIEGMRPCAFVTFSAPQINQIAQQLPQGIIIKPFNKVPQGDNFSNLIPTGARTSKTGSYVYNAVIGSEKNCDWFIEAWQQRDDNTIGMLLGFPKCCISFFHQVWKQENFIDTAWPMAINSPTKTFEEEYEIHVKDVESNPLFRWMGVRDVFHLPCNFHCKASIEIADNIKKIGHKHGYSEEISWQEEALSWPMEWSALHGILQLKTPIMRVSTITDATPYKYTIKIYGKGYPDEGATGLSFPFNQPRRKKFTDSKSYKKGLDNPMPSSNDRQWTDNGFTNKKAMEEAHTELIETLQENLTESPKSILDLGCGNGLLLKKISEKYEKAMLFGVEIDKQRLKGLDHLLKKTSIKLINGDVTDETLECYNRTYELTIVMAGRILEAKNPEQLLQTICNCSKNILVYFYKGYNNKNKSIEDLLSPYNINLKACNDRYAFIN